MFLVTGGGGQLATEFERYFPSDQLIVCSEGELDILDKGAVYSRCKDSGVRAIINCAAYTNVDGAESDEATANKVNGDGVAVLAEVCKELDLALIHFSTDYVFSGEACRPYNESDLTVPSSVYGSSKLLGEKALFEVGCRGAIFRVSWLYSSHGKSFVNTMLRLMKEKEELGVVSDQVGSPTFAKDVVCFIGEKMDQILALTEPEVFHLSNDGVCSWYDFAQEIAVARGFNTSVRPIATEDFPTPARRPSYSVMSKKKAIDYFGRSLGHWRQSLLTCLSEIKES